MKTKFRVVFCLRTAYTNKEKKHPLDIRLYLNSERITLGSTGLFLSANLWDSRGGRAKGRTAEAVNANAELSRIEADLNHIFRMFEFDPNLSLDMIKAEYLGENKQSTSFMNFFDEFVEKVGQEVGKSRCYASWQKFNVLKKHFVAFIKSRYNRTDLQMNELSYRIISDLEHYLLTEGKCKHNTVMRMMGNFKTITIRAQKMGLLDHDPYVNYKIHFNKTDRGYLTDKEIQILMDKEFTLKRLEFVRDIFVFSCFTGLAYIDVAQLTKDNIKEFDGRLWIMTKRQKTNVPSNVLLLDIPLQIIKKYDGVDAKGRLLPIFSNQRMNSYLKEIADLCGIDRRLTFHLARHTFATLALSKGVPIESLSKMLGHTKIATTQIYARITNKKIEADMLALSEKLGNFDSDNITSSTDNVEKARPTRFDEEKPVDNEPLFPKSRPKSGASSSKAKKSASRNEKKGNAGASKH